MPQRDIDDDIPPFVKDRRNVRDDGAFFQPVRRRFFNPVNPGDPNGETLRASRATTHD